MRREITVLRPAVVLSLILVAGACHKKTPAQLPPGGVAEPTTSTPPPPAPPTCTLSAEPAAVELGKSVVLSWKSENATDLDLQPGLGKQQAQGSVSVTPQESTTYTMTVSGSAGNGSCTARVTVTVPPPPQKPQVQEESLEEQFRTQVKDAYFALDKSDLSPEAQQALTDDAAFLKAHSDVTVTLEGNCDERGSEEYNLGLGDRRAQSAKQFILALGVPAARISTISYGKDRPVCLESQESCWWKNRRVHVALNKGGAPGGL
ncbi:MAG TPA: peptidoglycan-associated lipoprotein Pal [Terriglobia bacterium]|nr:peptidoglycan-associated lipoprotein Pal [Terriglobia bacterium]